MSETDPLAADALTGPLALHVPRQRWFSGGEDDLVSLEVTSVEPLDGQEPALAQVLVRTRVGDDDATYQLVLSACPAGEMPEALDGRPEAVVYIGEGWVVYDAMVDPELGRRVLARVAPAEHAERARPLLSEQSNTSVVYDERLILKLFRRVVDGPNPDAEVTRALAATGFANVARPVAEWSDGERDFAIVSIFLAGASDGFHLALTSLRDLFDTGGDPAEAGGDFGPDARRLGIVTAKLHLALAEAFGTWPADPAAWADDMEDHLARVPLDEVDPERVRSVYERLRHLSDPGVAIRVHGDYHLGQVLRTDAGWFVLDFEGEPDRPLEARRRPSSPMRDVAGMVRSFHYAAQVARREYGDDPGGSSQSLADAWERHNAFAFVEGYLAADGIDALLPAEADHRELVLGAFELDKAVYEVGYEQGHRPDWADIPLTAVRRVLELEPQ